MLWYTLVSTNWQAGVKLRYKTVPRKWKRESCSDTQPVSTKWKERGMIWPAKMTSTVSKLWQRGLTVQQPLTLRCQGESKSIMETTNRHEFFPTGVGRLPTKMHKCHRQKYIKVSTIIYATPKTRHSPDDSPEKGERKKKKRKKRAKEQRWGLFAAPTPHPHSFRLLQWFE